LILDEAHRLEEEIVRHREVSISKRRWKRYIPNLRMVDYGYDIEKWIDFLIELETRMLDLIGNGSIVESLSISRRVKYNWTSKKTSNYKNDEQIAEKYDEHFLRGSSSLGEELTIESIKDTERLTGAIDYILSNPRNWTVSEIKRERYEVISVELKPLDVSPYCKDIFERCTKTLMMSATILDSKTFCMSIGLAYDEVKLVQVGSDFPVQNRLIYPMGIAYLNSHELQQHEVQTKICGGVDKVMTIHKNHKGIILTTSYEQVNFIKQNISEINKRRLLETNPDIPRDEVIAKHLIVQNQQS
jgi:Rad3-related DNA helicase